jgi:2-polyprenyl-3-methyl-5-hydroxy-6-metoxy-1,4-benzoquinol methylase
MKPAPPVSLQAARMSTTHVPSDPVATLKQAHRATWAAGDYAAVARHIADGPVRDAIAAARVLPGASVLDVATGSGNVAVRAAQAGARVVGLDLVPELLDVARTRALVAGAEIEWVHGDAEAMPFGDGSFDCVTSVFGVQFAPCHQVTADELVRVCRPGGTIGLVNWTPEGLIGQMFTIMGGYLPAAMQILGREVAGDGPEPVQAGRVFQAWALRSARAGTAAIVVARLCAALIVAAVAWPLSGEAVRS